MSHHASAFGLTKSSIWRGLKEATGAMVESAAVDAFAELVKGYAEQLLQETVHRY